MTLEARLEDCRDRGTVDGKPGNFACVSLLYGTNRTTRKDGDNFYGKAPLALGSETVLGEVVVSIPKSHQPGKDIKGANRHVGNDEIKYRAKVFAIWGGQDGPQELTRDQFIAFTKHKIKGLDDDDKTAFVFVHGFNVSFESAAYTTAQLKADLGIEGPAFFYSWPSNGSTKQYINDQQDADLSADNLADYLTLIKDTVGDDVQLNIIAHSMGHRVVGQAFNKLRSEQDIIKPYFKTGIFASADLDESLFNQWVIGNDITRSLVERSVLYVTDDDRALKASKKILFLNCDDDDRKYRVGLVTKSDCVTGNRRVSVFPRPYETIDLSSEPGEKMMMIFGKNHNKYTKSPKIICHMARLFDGGEIAKQTGSDLIIRQSENDQKYWITNSDYEIDWTSDC